MDTSNDPGRLNLARKIHAGMVYSALSFLLSIAISFYIYKFLWSKIDRPLFVAWFAVFEISQFLLLLDLGFTHTFVRRYIKSPDVEIRQYLPDLRGTLILSGIVAAGLLLVLAAKIGSLTRLTVLPYSFLAASILLTLASYAETATLRIKLKFKELYLINIFSNLTFAIYLCVGYPENALDRLALAILLRSALQLAAQNIVLRMGVAVRFRIISGGNFEVISLNSSYFLLFLFDVAILKLAGISTTAIALVIILRKYYDALRGLWESMLNVAAIDFAHLSSQSRAWRLRAIVIASFCSALILSGHIIQIWLGPTEIRPSLNIAIATSTLMLTIFRLDGTRLFFQHRLNAYWPLATSVVIKSTFLALVLNEIIGLAQLYFIQALMLVGATLIVSLGQGRSMVTSHAK
jgi:hypothetical protein